MNNHDENIKLLRLAIIFQLKCSKTWIGNSTRFHNEYLTFSRENKNRNWTLNFRGHTRISYLGISRLHFWFLRKFYVRRVMVLNRNKEISEKTDLFFKKNKSLLRKIKIKNILDE